MRILTVVLSAAVLATPAAAQSVDATINRAVEAWENVKTVRGTFEQTVSNQLTGATASAKGKFVQEKPNRLAIRFSDPSSDAIVADGKFVWVYLPSSVPGQVVKKPGADRSAVPVDLAGQFLDAPRTKYDIASAAARTVDGHATHGLLLVARKGSAVPVVRATVWIDDDDSLIREFESTEASGVTRHVKLTGVEINGPVTDADFAFTPPRGVKVVDQTKL